MSWTEERVVTLRKLWGDGLSASQIAGALGGVTRNAVIGKVHRLGLSGRVKAAPIVGPQRRAVPATAAPAQRPVTASMPMVIGNVVLKAQPVAMPRPAVLAVVAQPAAEIVVAERTTILTLTHSSCRWPIGDPGADSFHFCGRQSSAALPYCAGHARVAYQPVAMRRRDRR